MNSWKLWRMTLDAARLRKIIEELKKEVDLLNYVIRVLEQVATGKPRRGRPPKAAAKGPPGR